MAWYISNSLINVYQVLFLLLNLNPKLNKFATFSIIYVPFTFFALLQRTMPPVGMIIVTALAWIVYFISAWLLFKDKPRTKIFMLIAHVAICYSIAILFTALSLAITNDANEMRAELVIPYHITLIVILMCFTFFKQKINLTQNSLGVFGAIVLVQLIFAEICCLFIAFGVNPFENSAFSEKLSNSNSFALAVIVIAAMLCLISDALFLFLMNRLSKSEKAKEEFAMREYKNQINLDYYKSIEKNAEETRKLRHDMANIIQVVGSLIDGSSSDKNTAAQLYSQLSFDISKINLAKYSGNSLVNSIIANKAALCKEKLIDLILDVAVPEQINIEEIDICKLYVNILDNAINAVLKLPESERKIHLKSGVEDNRLYISCKNSYLDEEESQKKKDRNHGYGQKILTDIADKYNGTFSANKENGEYKVLIYLQFVNN